jgi:hypothetical protein
MKKDERPTSNAQHRILNKVFCQFINWRSEAISSFDVQFISVFKSFGAQGAGDLPGDELWK